MSPLSIRNLLIGLSLFYFTNTGTAQAPCNEAAIMQIKGSWKKLSDENTFPDPAFPKNQYTQVNTRIDYMQKMLQAAYPEPMGIEAGWYRSISGNAEVKSGPVPYALDAVFHAYFCNTAENKMERGNETGTFFYIWANQINSWFAQTIKIYTINNQPVYLLNKKTGTTMNDYPVYEGVHFGSSNTGNVYSRAVIITRNGQSPYLPVTQKQFLNAFLKLNEAQFSKDLAFQEKRAVKTEAEDEAERKKYLETLERITPADKLTRAKDNFLRNYISSAQRKAATIAATIKNHEADMAPARAWLADSLKTDLEQPAILDQDNLYLFKNFSTAEKGGQQLVRLNPGYFNMNLPKYVPQFLIVYWRWAKGKPQEDFKNKIEATFNFAALKAMIDK